MIIRRYSQWLLIVMAALASYYLWVNKDATNMTTRQKILKTIYPLLQLFSGKENVHNEKTIQPPQSFYTLKATANDGSVLDFTKLKGKKVLLVNTASDCGYTPQYKELQNLYQSYQDKLVVIAFPANDFKEQEKGDDASIAGFCQKNYGVTFPLMKKTVVTPGSAQNEVFTWLTQKNKNGWNDKAPEWNFSKYLVNEHGILTHYFSPGVSPTSKEIEEALQ